MQPVTNKASFGMYSRVIFLIVIANFFVACMDGGVGGGGGGPALETAYVRIERPLSSTVKSATISLEGEATCDACPPSAWAQDTCPALEGERSSAIGVGWSNLTTGQSGPASHRIIGYHAYLPFAHICKTVYQHLWSAYDIPLTIGENVIEITASGGSYAPGTASITITRLLTPIQNLKAVSGKQQVTLSWDPMPEATSYNVYWSTSRDVGTTNGTLIANVSNPYIHTGLLDNTTYYYIVTAVVDGFESEGSNVVWSTPGWLVESVVVMPVGVSPGDIALAVNNAGQAHIHYSYVQNISGLRLQSNRYANNTLGYWDIQSGSILGKASYVNADIAVESPNNVHVSLLSNVAGSDGLRHGVFAYGAGWTDETVDAAGTCDASLALDAANKAHIVYFSGYGLTGAGLRYATNSSGAWANGVIANFGFPFYCRGVPDSVSLGIDSAGIAHVAYDAPGSGNLEYATNAGGTWVISTVWPSHIQGVSLAVDSNGITHIVFADGSSTLRYAHNTLGTWTIEAINDQTLLGEPYYLSNPSISVDAAGKAHVVYFHSVYKEIRYATNSQGNWHISSIETVDDPLAKQVPTDTAIDAQGNVHFVYFTTKSVRYATNK